MNIMQPVVAAVVLGVPVDVHIWQIIGSNHLWRLNVCFVGPEVGSDLSDAQLLDRAKAPVFLCCRRSTSITY